MNTQYKVGDEVRINNDDTLIAPNTIGKITYIKSDTIDGTFNTYYSVNGFWYRAEQFKKIRNIQYVLVDVWNSEGQQPPMIINCEEEMTYYALHKRLEEKFGWKHLSFFRQQLKDTLKEVDI